MKPLFYSDGMKRLVCAYVELISDLPLYAAVLPPTFGREIVLAAWKEGFALALANCSDEETAALLNFPTIDLARRKNTALHIDLYFHGDNYLDFVLRRVKYDTCVSCAKDYQNIVLPPNKRLCFCIHNAREQYISDVLCNNMADVMLEEPLSSVFRMVKTMLTDFQFNIARDGEVVIQE
ncbi:hypothetical protein E8E12_007573 [Didymella heteroderae]|uniref:Uncharacterized protein n=1 Tax=Didymella heteroderae TaxID=1769908 RepID=A0A9P4WQ63_9PLEO|nr:hypothetical protein E8E12_007573 [Didymella heteroderae]